MLMQVRPFETRDLDAAAAAMTAAARRAYAYFGWNHAEHVMRQWIVEDPKQWTSTWVAEIAGHVAGFMALQPSFLDQLFIAPHWQGRGLGNALINKAKAVYPHGLSLHCAQGNRPACRFYEHHGFVAVAHRIYQPAAVGDIVYRWHGH
jgi:putative acetyltransferase